MITGADIETRLRLARELIARRTPPSVHLADQVAAAGVEARALLGRLGGPAPLLFRPSDDARAYLGAGLLACTTMCPHLKHGGPRPAFARPAQRRVDCVRCAGAFRHPPVVEGDCCDLCEARGVAPLVPLAMTHGAALIIGDTTAADAAPGVMGRCRGQPRSCRSSGPRTARRCRCAARTAWLRSWSRWRGGRPTFAATSAPATPHGGSWAWTTVSRGGRNDADTVGDGRDAEAGQLGGPHDGEPTHSLHRIEAAARG